MNKPKVSKIPLLFLLFYGAIAFAETIDSGQVNIEEKLRTLKEKVEDSVGRIIRFREERFFPFKSEPIELKGVVRMDESGGISIEYPESDTVLIADDDGILMRKFEESGRVRERPSPVGVSSTGILLGAALRFDLVELEQLFFLTWFEADSEWSIVMTPRALDKRSLQQVTMSGTEDQLFVIEVGLTGKRKIMIFPMEERPVSEFSAEDRLKYFRNSVVADP